MLKKPFKPKERYIKYSVKHIDDDRCQFHIIYFIDKGNPISDMDARREKTLLCLAKNLETIESKIQRKIYITQKHLEKAYSGIGASVRNIERLVQEKMR